MRLRVTLVALILTLAGVVRASQQAPVKPPPQNGAAKGFRAEFLSDLADLQKKSVDLANAVPAEKYGWRPAEGVRSISEVYTHMAGGTYFLATFIGEQPPADMPKDIEKITDKQTVVAELQKSFDYIRGVMKKTSDSDLDKPVTLFGNPTTLRGVFVTILNHLHEHLGQSVAYARMNKIVPPWSR
jgi:uncharacterized damage-inducible protein DinB